MTSIALVQGSADWLAFRKNKIGASDASIIIGLNPWRTALELWEEKVGLREAIYLNDSMREGQALESQARKKFQELNNEEFLPHVSFHKQNEWLIASLDGINGNKTKILEIKCGNNSFNLAKNKIIPDYYNCQMQHQMEVTGLNECDYFCYRNDDEYVHLVCKRDQAFIDLMIPKLYEFWKCIRDFIPPPSKYSQRNDQEWIETAKQYQETSSQIKWLESREKELRQSLINMTNGENSEGGGLKVTKFIRKGAIPYSEIPEIQVLDLEKHRKKPIESWRIS